MYALTPEQQIRYNQNEKNRQNIIERAQALAKEQAQALALEARDKRRADTISASSAKTEANRQELAKQNKF